MLVDRANSKARFHRMTASRAKPTKPAVPAEIVAQEAAALRALFDSFVDAAARRGTKISQEQFGLTTGIGSQGMVWQYMQGRRALGLEAAVKFAKALGAKIGDFSPRLDEVGRQAVSVLRVDESHERAGDLSEVAREFAVEISKHPPEMQARMLAILRIITQPAVTDAEVEKRMPVTATRRKKPPR